MEFKPKFSSGLWVFGGCLDRFCPKGYSELRGVEEQIELASRVDGLEGIECTHTDFLQISSGRFMDLIREKGLVCTHVNTNVFGDAKWKYGAFSSSRKEVRESAISEGKKAVDLARELGCRSVGLWLGSDGFDYPFQVDYREHWKNLILSIKEITEYASPDVKVGLEYKLKEPRTHMSISDAGKALSICMEIGAKNLGVIIDFGHALMCGENAASSLVFLVRNGKLFNVHFNDCYRTWDDDMVVGSVNFWETLEFLYYCVLCEYDGWFGLDMFPYREDPVRAAELSIKNIKMLLEIAGRIDRKKLEEAQSTLDAIPSHEIVREAVFKS
jgi:xylose isomerase